MINAEWTGMNKPVFVFGKKVIEYLVRVGGGVQMILLAFLFLPTLWRNRKEVYRQMMLCGIKSFGVTSVVALFTGMILALQAGLILKAYGQEMRVGFLVAQMSHTSCSVKLPHILQKCTFSRTFFMASIKASTSSAGASINA